MNSKNLEGIMGAVSRELGPDQFTATADKIKTLGWGHAHNIGFSFTDADFKTLRDVREKHLAVAEASVAKLPATLAGRARDEEIVGIYTKATNDMSSEAKSVLAKQGSALYAMNQAGVKPGWDQLRQLVLAPMLLQNAKGETIPVPVTKSYTEGLDTAGYWVASAGARKGLIEKVQSVSKPGALNKQIMNTTLDSLVVEDDCGTVRGLSLNAGDRDVIDRYLAKSVTVNGDTISAGTLITPRIQSALVTANVGKIQVRSPLRCHTGDGICSKCYGISASGKALDKGTNIGIIAGQAIGERGTQLSMKQFHTGGVAGGGSGVVSSLDRVTQLLKMPEKLPGQATLASSTGQVTNVSASPAGGWDVFVGTTKHYVPASRKLQVVQGQTMQKGSPLSSGPINPHELLALTDIETVQQYLADEIHDTYASEGVRRRNVEVIVRSLTNLGQVEDPGQNPKLTRGDMIKMSAIKGEAYMGTKVTPRLKGIETLPLDHTEDWATRLHYRRQKSTIQEAAAQAWESDIHGSSPIPGIVWNAEFGQNPTKDPGKPY
jgi:DNA-directed RNA polymerase subunit beta'